VSSPERRVAAVSHVTLTGTRSDRTIRFDLLNDLALGDLLQREALFARWRDEPAPDWRFDLDPHFEYRHDQTFDRDRQEWRGALGARTRKTFGDGESGAEMGVRGDFVRTSGQGMAFLL